MALLIIERIIFLIFLTGQEGEFQEGEFVFSLVSFSSVCLWWIVTEIIERKIQHFFIFFLFFFFFFSDTSIRLATSETAINHFNSLWWSISDRIGDEKLCGKTRAQREKKR